MKTTGHFHRGATAVATALLLAACGGGGGIDGTGGSGGGAGPLGVSYGTITGLGSIWVNGIRFDTSNTTVNIDDRTGSAADLKVGMLVKVEGSISGGTAQTVTVDDSIKGRVEQKLDDNRWVVMGQTVQIDDSTKFDNAVRPNVGDFVHVHGQVVASGTVAAGFIEVRTAGEAEAKGVVSNHDTVARSFRIGDLTVNYTSGTITGDMPGGSWNGLVVEAKGTCAGNPVCTTLSATKVEPDGPGVTSIGAAEVEGFVLSGTVADFRLGAQRVVTNGATRFENGTAADFALGAKLEAEGSIAGGVLTATKVSFRDNVRLEGNVTLNSGGRITLAGLAGIGVRVTSVAELDGATSLSQITAGTRVRVRGRQSDTNEVFATRLEVKSPDNRIEVRAPVTLAANPQLTMLGTSFNLSTVSQFRDRNDNIVNRDTFFNGLVINQPIKLSGRILTGLTPTWEEAELED